MWDASPSVSKLSASSSVVGTPERACVTEHVTCKRESAEGPIGTKLKMACGGLFTGGGMRLPERNEGQREWSSGRDADEGDKWDKIMATCLHVRACLIGKDGHTSRSWTSWCVLRTNLEASRHWGVCFQ